MIGLAPGDSVGGAPSGPCTVIATVFGEQIPVGGGAPTPYYNVVNLTSQQWYTLANAAIGFQVLVNKIVLNNQGGLAAIAVEQFSNVTGGYVNSGALVGGDPYVTIPAGGTAIHGRDGWRILTSNGSEQQQVISEGVCQAGGGETINAPQNMVWNGALKNGTFLTASTTGLAVTRSGVYVITAGIRWGAPGTGNRFSTLTIGGAQVMNDYFAGSAQNPSPTIGQTLAIVSSVASGNSIGVNLWTDTAASAISNAYLNACWLGPSV